MRGSQARKALDIAARYVRGNKGSSLDQKFQELSHFFLGQKHPVASGVCAGKGKQVAKTSSGKFFFVLKITQEMRP